MNKRTVTVIGGGIAGLSAAVFLNEKGFKVTIIEASPKLGGRAYSFFDKEKQMFFDNGQHILAGWYENTFEYLKIIGTYDKLDFQKTLEINFIDVKKKIYRLKCPEVPPPMNLVKGLIGFKALAFKDKFALKNIYSLIKKNEGLDKIYPNVRELLKGMKQTENLMKYFWEPFVLAVFNSTLENIGVKVFLNLLNKGFNEKDSSLLVIPEVNLNELLIDNAIKYFEKNSVEILIDKAVDKIVIENGNVKAVIVDGQKIFSDYYVSAVSFFAFKKLFDEIIYEENNFKSELLKPSSIVSVHLFFDEKIPDKMIPYNSFGMTGLIGTIVQWIFKRSDHHLTLIISGADFLQIAEMKIEDIYNLCLNELNKTIEGFEKIEVSGYKVIKEKRATFIPDFMSNNFRPKQCTGYENFFITGDWTDTGLPATIESAVTSAKICSELIGKNYKNEN